MSDILSISPFDFFRTESSNSDILIRTNAMSKILVIFSLMSPEKIRNDMIPYLLSKLIL